MDIGNILKLGRVEKIVSYRLRERTRRLSTNVDTSTLPLRVFANRTFPPVQSSRLPNQPDGTGCDAPPRARDCE